MVEEFLWKALGEEVGNTFPHTITIRTEVADAE